MRKKTGRQSTYTDEIGDRICHAIRNSTKGIEDICKENEGFPCHQTVMEWRHKHPSFGAAYARAKQAQIDLYVEETIRISDDASGDLIDGENGIIANHAAIQRARLKVDTRKWLAAKLMPKVYGEKSEIITKTDFESMSPEERKAFANKFTMQERIELIKEWTKEMQE